MTRDEAISALTRLKTLAEDDPEAAHGAADEVLIRFIRVLGYDDVATAWEAIKPKWYA